MQIVGWILAALLLILIAVGVGCMRFMSRRRTGRDPADPQVLETTDWKKYKTHIQAAVDWLAAQEKEELHVISYDDKLLHGTFVPCENARGTILLFHGYRSHYLVDFSAALPYYQKLGFNLLLCDQRSHRQSGGKYITFGIRERFDVLSWVTYLSMKLGEAHPLYLDGLSMGATTVLMAADMEFPGNVRGILADCGFTSPGDIIRHLVQQRYHLPPKPVTAFIGIFTKLFAGFGMEQWSTCQALKNARYPVLLLHGLADDFVPSWMSRAAYEACTSEKTLIEVEGAAHGCSYLVETDRCKQALREFLEGHLT